MLLNLIRDRAISVLLLACDILGLALWYANEFETKPIEEIQRARVLKPVSLLAACSCKHLRVALYLIRPAKNTLTSMRLFYFLKAIDYKDLTLEKHVRMLDLSAAPHFL